MFPNKLDIYNSPTQINLLERTTAHWGGSKNIWIKRDDDTGGLTSGNKVRKLAYVVYEALEIGADTLITCGGVQSNHCRATAAIARRHGLSAVLLLGGNEPDRSEGNYFLDKLLGVDIRFIAPSEYKQRNEIMEQVACDLRRAGRNPYVIAEGASSPMGSWGYIQACQEIADTQKELGVTFDAIVSAVGSGGTIAGMVLGKQLFKLHADIWGVNVCQDEVYFNRAIRYIASETIDRFELPDSLDPGQFGIIDGYVGRGYALSQTCEIRFILEMARREGIILDPVYTGKAFFGLYHELESERFRDAKNILFIHTGGIYGTFPMADEIDFDGLDDPVEC